MVPSRSRALLSTATTFLPMVALIVLVSPGAWALDGREKGGISAEAAGCPIGVYVTSLRDLDPVGDSFGIDFVLQPAQRPVQQVEETITVEIDADLGVGFLARHTVEVADGLAAGEVALALDVDPHRTRLQQARFEYCRYGDGIVQRRDVA